MNSSLYKLVTEVTARYGRGLVRSVAHSCQLRSLNRRCAPPYRRKNVRRSGPGQDTVEKQQATGRRNLANRFVLTRGPMADNVVLRYRLVQLVDRIELAKREGRGFEFCSCSIGDGSLSCTPALRPGRSLVAQCVIPENSEGSVSSVLIKCMRGPMT